MGTGTTTTWRPQAFGRRNVRDISDPVIEPLWRGDRVIVTVQGGTMTLFDTEGEERVEGLEEIMEQLRRAVLADEAVLDGYLTRQATQPPTSIRIASVQIPTASQMTSQMLVGRSARVRSMARLDEDDSAGESASPLALVVVDLLSVDGLDLLGIPLLERKRHLESTIAETELVRRGAYVRLPVDTWLASWRALGFRELAYKAANGRYVPGGINDSWAIVRIPTT
jgi:ATP-dependent DNA ligase